jgi:hypothetical protein
MPRGHLASQHPPKRVVKFLGKRRKYLTLCNSPCWIVTSCNTDAEREDLKKRIIAALEKVGEEKTKIQWERKMTSLGIFSGFPGIFIFRPLPSNLHKSLERGCKVSFSPAKLPRLSCRRRHPGSVSHLLGSGCAKPP